MVISSFTMLNLMLNVCDYFPNHTESYATSVDPDQLTSVRTYLSGSTLLA